MKQCTVCNKFKGYDNFYKNKLTKDGYGSQCKECDTIERKKTSRKKKEYLVNLFGGKCVKCGYSKCISALEFHHRNPEEKEFAINSKYSIARLIEEAKKCDLLCANCHREEHNKWADIP